MIKDKGAEGQKVTSFNTSATGNNNNISSGNNGNMNNTTTNNHEEEIEEETDTGLTDIIPTKLVSTTLRVQFTCEFKELNLSGKADLKAIKTVVSKMTPARMIVLRGSDTDCTSMLAFAKTNGIEGYVPKSRNTIEFEVRSEKLRVQVPQSLLPSAMRPVKHFLSTTGTLTETKCSVVALRGALEESRTMAMEGTRLIKYQGAEESNQEQKEEGTAVVEEITAVRDQTVTLADSCIGVVSVGEVTLNSLKLLIEASGTPVEYRIDSQGALLVCADQVIVRKENLGDFAIEGPPVPAFYAARKALYQQFAFV